MTSVRVIAWSVALAANAAILVGLRMSPFLQHALQAEELPEPFVRHRVEFYPWPLAGELAPTLAGLTEREVQAFFNDPYQLPPSEEPGRCLEFRQAWDPSVTVLFHDGRAEAVWIEPEPVPPNRCVAVITRTYPFSLPLN
jgi:hypothetical protein